MDQALLFTQCLQNDFVKPIKRYEALPNQLHVGYEEAARLIGESIETGPVTVAMEWAYAQAPERLGLIHIRDWHDPADARQAAHLAQFGPHCIRDTPGADFVFREAMRADRPHVIVNASGLNDFVDTTLAAALEPYRGRHVRVGLMGVWTEAKITFLAYDLATRYPEFEIAVCSALAASSSRSMHFVALEQLKNILGVRVYSSVGAFTEFLTGTQPALEARIQNARIDASKIRVISERALSETDQRLLLYLFRDCLTVDCVSLDGGFSGNVVLKAQAADIYGHQHVPHVVKIGPRDSIAGERTAFERVQEILGNSAPGIVDFAELADRGAIKYRYAGMLDGNVRTFQKLYAASEYPGALFDALDTVFQKQLGRFFDAAARETLNLLKYYDFDPKYAPGVRRRVEALLGAPADGEEIEIAPGVRVPNPCLFYERDLKDLSEAYAAPHYVSYLHGDLNGANILIDASDNVWMIDFFHTHRGHILRDLIKLENDILYIFMKIESEAEFREATQLVHLLIDGEDLGVPPDPDDAQRFSNPKLQMAFRVIQRLRSYYPALIELDRDPYQLYVGVVRYAMHTLAFDESNDWQRKLALYTGSICAARVRDSLRFARGLRVDETPLDAPELAPLPGALGITILPGRKDRLRDLAADLDSLLAAGYHDALCLLTEDEFELYGVTDLKTEYERRGVAVRYFPIPDQGTPPASELEPILDWMDATLRAGKKLLVHCVGGVGRSGTAVAAYLIRKRGLAPRDAIERVRTARSKRAVENSRQESFVLGLSPGRPA